jgi:tetratricopeptide (TPR) repeat protein
MSDSSSLRDRYLNFIDRIIQMTLKGQIRSKEQVYQMLIQEITAGTGELFEQGLLERIEAFQKQHDTQTDELKQAKAARSLRALHTIRGEWERWQEQNRANDLLSSASQQIATSDENEVLLAFLRVIDPNRPQPLTLVQWNQLSKRLGNTSPENSALQNDLQQIAAGITDSLEDWAKLEDHLVSWMYEQSRGQLGFEGVPGQRGPWSLWAKQVQRPLLQSFFQTLAMEQSIIEWIREQSDLSIRDWVEIVGVLRCLQQGLVTWFDKLVYDSKVGSKLSISTFLAFAVIWSQFANGLQLSSLPPSQRDRLTNACFQVTLQILRTFAQQPYFPLYGSIFASFSGQYLRDALNYLDEPLRRAEGTQEKARILTLLGYSFRAQGQVDRAIDFHLQALEIAREAGDRLCEIANFNHLSRTHVAEGNYAEAINSSQRALILSRQTGDRPGEANALANLGYSEVFQAQHLESEPEVYEMAVGYLQQGLQLSERLGDHQSQALCFSSLGIAQVVLEAFQEAIATLEKGVLSAQFTGDTYLQGINLSYLAEAHRQLNQPSEAIYTGSLAMYLLYQIVSNAWRQSAGLLSVLQGQLGVAEFQTLLAQQRPRIIAVIGVDGFDYLPQLLQEYRE